SPSPFVSRPLLDPARRPGQYGPAKRWYTRGPPRQARKARQPSSRHRARPHLRSARHRRRARPSRRGERVTRADSALGVRPGADRVIDGDLPPLPHSRGGRDGHTSTAVDNIPRVLALARRCSRLSRPLAARPRGRARLSSDLLPLSDPLENLPRPLRAASAAHHSHTAKRTHTPTRAHRRSSRRARA
ncbi:uncharacterized protein SCHCODRAFT_084899, partial [Schizophyllum commune H4-8]